MENIEGCYYNVIFNILLHSDKTYDSQFSQKYPERGKRKIVNEKTKKQTV